MNKWLTLVVFLFQIPAFAEPRIQRNAEYFKNIQEDLAWFEAAELQIPKDSTRGLFLRVYHSVTKEMPNLFAENQFENPEWVEKLMLKYVSLYRNALDCSLSKSCKVSPAWRYAFAENDRNQKAPAIQLLLSISAHVNRDLPIALAAVHTDFNDVSLHRDFQRISIIFKRRMPELIGLVQKYQSCTTSRREQKMINQVIQWAMNGTRETSWSYGAQLAAVKTEKEERALLEHIEMHAKVENLYIKVGGPVPGFWICL